jgi:uncharacterized membrane protein
MKYNFFTPTVALFIPFIVSLFVATVAAVNNKLNLGIYGVLIGFVAPLLTHIEILDKNLIFIYLAVVTCSSIWLAFRKNWRVVNAISLVGVALYSFTTIDAHWMNSFIGFILFALCGLFFVVSILSVVNSKEDANTADMFVAVVNGLFLMMLVFTHIDEEFQSLVSALAMILFAFGSLFVFLKTRKPTFFFMYSLIAVAFLVFATAVELEGSALVFAFAVESASIAIMSYLITKNASVGLKMSRFMIVPLLMSLPSFVSYAWNNGVFHEDFFLIFVVGFLFVLVGAFFHLIFTEHPEQKQEGVSMHLFHITIGVSLFLALFWVALHAGMANTSVATTIALVTYTIIGISTYFKGSFAEKTGLKKFGATLLSLVVIRLLLVDVWNMPLAERIIVFVLVGVLFVSTAFIIKKKEKTSNL